MKKTLIALAALSGLATAADVTWTGAAGDNNWKTASNWSTNATPADGDNVTINNATVTLEQTTSGDLMGQRDQWNPYKITLNATGGSYVTLGTMPATTGWPNSTTRMRASFNIDETSTVVTNAAFLYGTNNIFGTLVASNVCDPAEANVTVNFGKSGIIQLTEGSKNASEGNGRTFTFGAVLDTGIAAADATYTLAKRYLMAGAPGGEFTPSVWDKLTLAGGSITGTNGLTLTSALASNPVFTQDSKAYTTETLTATADDFGKYILGADKDGIYVQYVKSSVVPEPTTATLSLLALAGLAVRRRRK